MNATETKIDTVLTLFRQLTPENQNKFLKTLQTFERHQNKEKNQKEEQNASV